MSAWDWQLINIYNAGIAAFEEGKLREDCPYKWSRQGVAQQRWKHWHEGFGAASLRYGNKQTKKDK